MEPKLVEVKDGWAAVEITGQFEGDTEEEAVSKFKEAAISK